MSRYWITAALALFTLNCLQAAAETPEPAGLRDCSAVLKAARIAEFGQGRPFAFIGIDPALSFRGCGFIAFYRVFDWDDDRTRRVRIHARHWRQEAHAGHSAVRFADSQTCSAMAPALRALKDVRPEFDIPKPGETIPSEPLRVMIDGTSLTFATNAVRQFDELSNGIRELEFTTLDFPGSPISRWLTNELPRMKKCWQPEETMEESFSEVSE